MNLFVAGLPPGTSERDVRALFEPLATVLRVATPGARLGTPRPFLHVHLGTDDDALLRKCIQAVCRPWGTAGLP